MKSKAICMPIPNQFLRNCFQILKSLQVLFAVTDYSLIRFSPIEDSSAKVTTSPTSLEQDKHHSDG